MCLFLGVYISDNCGTQQFNHSVLVAGYGTDTETGLESGSSKTGDDALLHTCIYF
mgnify:CR=1 FL=1